MSKKYYIETGYIITDGKRAYGCLSDWQAEEWCKNHNYRIIKKKLGLYKLDWLILAKKKKEKK